MKLLAVLGFALAVVAVDKTASGDKNLLTCEPKDLLELFEAGQNNPDYCSKILSMVNERKISLAENPKVVFPLIGYCLETGRFLSPKDLFEMDVVYVAAFIFMFRVNGYEEAAECLYNSAMENHFPVPFASELHKQPYTLDPLGDFKSLGTPKPLKGFECLKTKHERQLLFMLWAVQMYGKRPEIQDLRQKRLLKDLELVVLILVSMGFPLDLLVKGLIVFPKELSVAILPCLSFNFQLPLFSLTRDEYLGLGELEKAQLHTFIEKYVKFSLSDLNLLTKRLSGEELEQCRKAFELGYRGDYMYLDSDMLTDFTRYLYDLIQDGYPVLLLKTRFDFYLSELFSAKQAIPSKRCRFAKALSAALEMMREARPVKELVCGQIERTISQCEEKANPLPTKLSKEKESKAYAGLRLPD